MQIICIWEEYFKPYDCELFVFDRHTWYHITVPKILKKQLHKN